MQHDTTAILDLFDVEALQPEEQEQLLLDLGDIIFNGTMLRLRERMDASLLREFDALLDRDPSDEEMAAFLERIPGAEQLVAETVEQLQSDILASTGTYP